MLSSLVLSTVLSPMLVVDGFNESAEELGHKCLALTVFSEARGESERGQALVAQVVINRAIASDFQKDLCDIAHELRQFDGIWMWEYPRLPEKINATAWRKTNVLVAKVLEGGYDLGPCGRATNFHADYVAPDWKQYEFLCLEGRHLFYYNPNYGLKVVDK